MARMSLLLQVLVDFSNRHFFQSTVPVQLTEVHFTNEKEAAGFVKGETKQYFQSKVFNNTVLEAHISWLFLDTCGSRKRTVRDILLHILRYKRLVLQSAVLSNAELCEKRSKASTIKASEMHSGSKDPKIT